MPQNKHRGLSPSAERQKRYRQGLSAETRAAAMLVMRGHRILARRYKTPVGEIDLVTVKRRRIAFIEVKRRVSEDACYESLTPRLASRVRRAGQLWLASQPRYQAHDIGFDAVFVLPWRWPVYKPDSL